MKKKEIIVLSISIIGLITVSLYQTLATDITMNKVNSTDADLSYTFDITDQTGRVVNIKAGATKILDVFVTNPNNGTIKYGRAYTPATVKTDDITIAQLHTSKDAVSGLINKDERKQITLIIINNGTSDITLSLISVTGYEHGGDLIVPNNHTLITETSESYSVSLFVTNGTINGGYTLTNILPNSSFEGTGWSGCSYNTTYKKYGNYSCALTGTTSTPEILTTNSQNIYLNNTHIYYSRVEGYQTSKTGNQGWQTYWPIAEPSFGSVPFGEINKWNIYSLIANRTSFSSGNQQLRFDYDNNYNAGTVYYDGGMLIDLTESYGSGNEPSKEWLDTNIQYFEETASQLTEETIKGGEVSFEITPDSGYVIDTINCDGGNYNEDTNTLTLNNVTSNKSCFISFKRNVVYASEYIESLLVSNPETMNNDDPDGNVRYMGANPNNYVSFNNELWRIIGVFDVKSSVNGQTEKRLKIIRNESLGQMAWDSADTNNWTSASLQTYLNGDYYNSLDSISQSLIGDTYWNLGGTASYTSTTNGLASHFYGYERETTVYSGRPTFWVGKIGLMYPSDYGYATSGGTNTNRASCLAKEMYNWYSSSYSDCKNNDYLYISSFSQWTMTPVSSYSNGVFYVNSYSNLAFYYAYYGNAVKPTVYLKSSVLITSGDGSKTNPYILSA